MLLALGALAGPGLALAQPAASTPGVTFGEAPLMTPTDAATYYANQPSTVTYNWSSTKPPEIVEGMRREMQQVQNDPDAVFFYAFVQARATVY